MLLLVLLQLLLFILVSKQLGKSKQYFAMADIFVEAY